MCVCAHASCATGSAKWRACITAEVFPRQLHRKNLATIANAAATAVIVIVIA